MFFFSVIGAIQMRYDDDDDDDPQQHIVLVNLLSSILQTWPKSLSFFCFVKSVATVQANN